MNADNQVVLDLLDNPNNSVSHIIFNNQKKKRKLKIIYSDGLGLIIQEFNLSPQLEQEVLAQHWYKEGGNRYVSRDFLHSRLLSESRQRKLKLLVEE